MTAFPLRQTPPNAPSFYITRPKAPGLSELPTELLLKIFNFLTICDLGQIATCSQKLYAVSQDEELWKDKVERIRVIWLRLPQKKPCQPCALTPSYQTMAKMAFSAGWILDVGLHVKINHKTRTITLPCMIPLPIRWQMIMSIFHIKGVVPEKSFAIIPLSNAQQDLGDVRCLLIFYPGKNSSLYEKLCICDISTFSLSDAKKTLEKAMKLFFHEEYSSIELYKQYTFLDA
jgi:hypothetical protein